VLLHGVEQLVRLWMRALSISGVRFTFQCLQFHTVQKNFIADSDYEQMPAGLFVCSP
jgi:hypothetical protein